jgi:hypothetical protein
MSTNEPENSAVLTVKAVEAAIAANVLTVCPHHTNELIATGNDVRVQCAGDRELQTRIHEILASAPRYCPRCADEGE